MANEQPKPAQGQKTGYAKMKAQAAEGAKRLAKYKETYGSSAAYVRCPTHAELEAYVVADTQAKA